MTIFRSAFLAIVWCVLLSSINIDRCDGSKKYNRYLAHLFNKYGSGGTMSFEGLEHLMYNLGLGELEFSPTHTIEEHHPNGYKIPDYVSDDEYQNLIEEETISPPLLEEEDVKIVIEEQIKLNNRNNATKKAVAVPSGGATSTSTSASVTDKAVTNDLTSGGQLSASEIEFKEMHDPKHRHPRHNAEASDPNVCLSPKSLLRLVIDHDDLHKRKLYRTFKADGVGQNNENVNDHDFEEEYNEFINTVKLTPVGFMKLCPALLVQIDQHVCVQPAPVMNLEDRATFVLNAWIYASGSIFVLSSCGLLGILLVPLMKTIAYQEVLKFLVAVAVGTLSGDALMHLIPHALTASEHKIQRSEPELNKVENDGHDDVVWICACAFLTAVFMYILETILPLLKGPGSSHNHSHHHTPPAVPTASPADAAENPLPSESKEINIMLDELKKDPKEASRPLTPVAFMVIIGDGLHNLTDGLAIGAAFASEPAIGLATAFAVLCHELPHELGDFALLLQTGVSIRRAVLLNIASSILSFIGMAVGLLIAGVHTNMTRWIYAGTAGSFLYIAFADLIPAMSVEGKKDLKNSLIQVSGIIVGGIIMMIIALNEDSLESWFK